MATKPTPGASDGTYGTELNAFLDVSLAADGKIINEALQSASTAPSADAALANKKYVDDNIRAYIKLVDSKAANTAGGTFTTGAWRKRIVAEETDTGSNVSVSSSVIVLDAGTYECRISCPAFRVDRNQARLRNTTAGSTILVGTSALSDSTTVDMVHSFIVGRFTIAGSQNVEIQHNGQTTRATDGFGTQANHGENEIYTIAEFWKI